MIPPQEAAWRFLPGILLGFALGLLHGFLRPLRLRRPVLADLGFSAAMVYAWVYLSFAVCGGDLRLAYTLALLGAVLLWEVSIGRWLRPVFSSFWKGIFRILSVFSVGLKNFSGKCKNNLKIIFARRKKEGIINWNNRQQLRRRTGGKSHGT